MLSCPGPRVRNSRAILSSATPFGFNVCWILICVRWREEDVAASVQLRPAVHIGPASNQRAAIRPTPCQCCVFQSSLAVKLLQVLLVLAHRKIREYQNSSLRIMIAVMPGCPPWKPRLSIESVHPAALPRCWNPLDALSRVWEGFTSSVVTP